MYKLLKSQKYERFELLKVKPISKKAQVWYFDLTIALSIFLVTFVFAINFINSSYFNDAQSSNRVIDEAQKLSNNLLHTGIPEDWSNENVVSLGITTNNRLDLNKLERLKNLTEDDYAFAQILFGINSDFLVYFENKEGLLLNLTEDSYVGKAGYTPQTAIDDLPAEFVQVSRYMVYESNSTAQIISLNVVCWDD